MERRTQMINNERKTIDTLLDGISVIAGAFLLFSPWLFGFAAEPVASWNSWIAGALIALVGILAMVKFQVWQEWVNLALGAWTFIAATHMSVGVLVAALAAYELWTSHNRPLSAA
jgi:ABC-type Na+ efflux pump permease subunit